MKLYKYNPTTLQYVKVPYLYNIFKTVVLTFGASLLLGGITPLKTEYITDTESVILIQDQNEFTEEKLVDLIDKLNFKFPHIVLAQAKLETGRFESKIFKENNNLFGMKEARVRINLAKGTQHGHAYYDNWESSVYDYAFYQCRYLSALTTEAEYYRYLAGSYAEDIHYVSKVKNIANKLKDKF